MPVHNADIAAVFEEIADLLEIKDENPFRIRAYRNAARIVGDQGRDLAPRVLAGEPLPKLPGIGADLAGKVDEICRRGTCGLLEQLHRELPPAISALLKVPGLGPKRVRLLHDTLDVKTVEDLRRAAGAGRIRELPGFGEKTESRILEALAARPAGPQRFKLSTAAQYASALTESLARVPGVSAVTVAGSFRRGRDTVGDLDLIVAAAPGSDVMKRFTAQEDVASVIAQGETRASVLLRSGLQVDLRLVAPASYGAALQYFTGSKSHSIALRRIAQQRGLKINEYGVFRGRGRIAGETEESVYGALGLPWIPPELREDRGEIEAARRGELPRLVGLADLKGDLHAHTRATDGRSSLRDMALAAKAAGLAYMGITDHSRRLTVARGLDPRRLVKQLDEIDRLNDAMAGFTVLKGIEVDILEDGSLDLPDSALARLDLVVAAIHSAFTLPRRRQTERIVRALQNRYFTVLAHPAGRLIGSREAIDVDWLRVVRAARDRGCYLEVNSQPDRLDLDDVMCRMAKDEGVAVAISSDAHSTLELEHLRLGIGQARRGWLEPGDVLNTRDLAELRPLLARTMGR
jgi:DNA polymerase (family 10)